MRRVHRSALLPYKSEQVFDIVNDVLSYPDFLPWCAKSELLEQSGDSLVGRLTIAKGGVSQTFTTRNTLSPPGHMHLALVEGPFTTLEGDWQIHPLGDEGCRVEMTLKFEFDSRLAGMILGRVFEQAADTMVDAFCDRADEMYRKR